MKSKAVIKNYLYNVSYQIMLMIIPLITAPYIARVIGSTGVGTQTFYRSIATYFLLIAMLGVNNYGNRTIAAVRDDRQKCNKLFSSIYMLQVITSLISVSIYLVLCFFVNESERIIAFVQLLYIFSAALDINWFFFGLEEFKIVVTRKIIFKILSVISIFVFVKSSEDLWIYSLIISAEFFVGQSFLWLFAKKYVSFVMPKIHEVFAHLKVTAILFLPTVITFVYRDLSKVLLGILSSKAEVGFFEYSEKVIMMSLGFLTALGTVMLPKMAYLKANNDQKIAKRYLRDSMQFALILGFAIGFGYAAISPEFSIIYFGNEFAGTSILMRGLSITVPFIAWANVIRMQYLLPNSLDKVYLKSTLFGVVINIAINVVLIPKYGALGAVVATIFTEISVTVVQTILVRRSIEFGRYVLNGVPYLVIGLIMFICVRVASTIYGLSLRGLLLQLFVGLAVYLFLCVLYLYISKNEMATRLINSIKRKLTKKQ